MRAVAYPLSLWLALWLAACAGPAPTTAPDLHITSTPASVALAVYPDDDASAFIGRVALAKRRAWLKAYLLTDGRLIAALASAQRSGADVRVLLEDDVYGSDDRIRETQRLLLAAGVPVKLASAGFRLSHEKSAVIDDRAVIMTANLTLSAWTRNREFAAEIEDARLVAEVAACFEADWAREPCLTEAGGLVWSPDHARPRVLALVNSAVASLDVYTEVMQDREVVESLARRAASGVRVRVIMSPEPDAERPKSGPSLDELQRAGALVRLLSRPYIHAKAMLVDGRRAYVGSHNLSFSSLDLNRELGIVFDSAGAIARLARAFETDWSTGVDR